MTSAPVLHAGRIANRLLVARSKSDAGTERRPPIADPLREIRARVASPGPA
jgi:hypothetical protein